MGKAIGKETTNPIEEADTASQETSKRDNRRPKWSDRANQVCDEMDLSGRAAFGVRQRAWRADLVEGVADWVGDTPAWLTGVSAAVITPPPVEQQIIAGAAAYLTARALTINAGTRFAPIEVGFRSVVLFTLGNMAAKRVGVEIPGGEAVIAGFSVITNSMEVLRTRGGVIGGLADQVSRIASLPMSLPRIGLERWADRIGNGILEED